MVDFVSNQAALQYVKAWAIDEGFTRMDHNAHLLVEAAVDKIEDAIFRLEGLDK